MIIELLIILAILWFATQGLVSHNTGSRLIENAPPTKHEIIETKLREILSILDEICSQARIHTPFSLAPSETRSQVIDKTRIYLVVWDEKNQKLFDNNTILHAAIHELTHVLCPSHDPDEEHGELFDTMEEHFLKIAEQMGVYNPEQDPDQNYPCLHPENDTASEETTQTEASEASEETDDEKESDIIHYRKHEGLRSTGSQSKRHRINLKSH